MNDNEFGRRRRMEERVLNFSKATCVLKPTEGLTEEEERDLDDYVKLASSPAVPNEQHGIEQAYHMLYKI